MSDATPSQPQIKFIWIIGILGAFVIFAVVGAYSASVARHTTDYDQQRAQERLATLAKLRQAANETLTTADWIDQGKKIVRIPIDEAMTQEVAILQAQAPQAGCEIPGATPPPAPAPAAAAPPATNAAPAASAPPAKPVPPPAKPKT